MGNDTRQQLCNKLARFLISVLHHLHNLPRKYVTGVSPMSTPANVSHAKHEWNTYIIVCAVVVLCILGFLLFTILSCR